MGRRTEAWIMLPAGILFMVGSLFVWGFVELIPNSPLLEEILSGLGFIGGAILIMSSLMIFRELSREKKIRRSRGLRSH